MCTCSARTNRGRRSYAYLFLESPLDVLQTVEEVAFFRGDVPLAFEDDPQLRQLHVRLSIWGGKQTAGEANRQVGSCGSTLDDRA